MILIHGGTVVGAAASREADVLTDGEKIRCVRERSGGETAADVLDAIGLSAEEKEATEVVDATGKLVFPGFIDAHVHFDLHVAGTVTCDDFDSGTKAAIVGGTTTIIDMGTAYPGESLWEGLQNWHEKAAKGTSCDYGYHMTITDWNDTIRRECQDMVDEGIPTFKIYLTYDIQIDDKTAFQVMQRLKEVDGITGCHCENAGMIDALREEYAADERLTKVSSHYRTRPPQAEAEAIGRYLRLAEVAGHPVIDVHLTCEEGLNEIREARKRGVICYAETCPQYLTMDDALYELPGFEGAKYVCAPPLRKKKDREVLWKAVADGEIQTVCTDHCAFTTAQKELGRDDFRKIPGGMPGVETRAEVMFSEGVAKGRITKETLCGVCAENVARLYGLYPQKGVIREGADADLFILDPEAKKTITADQQVSRCDYAPLEGLEVTGVIGEVYLRGEKVAANGKVLKEHRGRFVKRSGRAM